MMWRRRLAGGFSIAPLQRKNRRQDAGATCAQSEFCDVEGTLQWSS
jgi:hypothetical protein